MKDRFDINILDENNWQIEDTKTGEYANPVDGVTNVLKGLIKQMNNYENKIKELENENEELKKDLSYYKDISIETEYKKIGQYSDRVEKSMYRKLSYKQKQEIEELEQIIQDNSDSVSNWFINYWDILTEEAKSDAHLELGIDIDYGG